MKNPIIILTGPTASGKTAMSLSLAKKFGGEIIAADSTTVYRGMDIGTDKLEGPQMKGINHHLLDIIDPKEEFNAAIFQDLTRKVVSEIQCRGKLPFIVGGSTMFIDAFAYNYKMPEVEPNQKLRNEFEGKTKEKLFEELVALDRDAEFSVDRYNKRRLIRALEVAKTTGKPFIAQKSKSRLPENILYLAAEVDRSELYGKINQRVDEMLSKGFLQEVEKLHKEYGHTKALETAGYRQLISYLDGKLTLDEAIEKTKQAHRNYAKKQLTWLNRNKDVIWVKNITEAENKISEFLAKK